mmetsp:Transcript_11186/g.30941  ORF Transcript_11186/g.30941 Transcript_11186/m.30941 type:complete len:211 (-) Transcript_11186:1786-2418(-)
MVVTGIQKSPTPATEHCTVSCRLSTHSTLQRRPKDSSRNPSAVSFRKLVRHASNNFSLLLIIQNSSNSSVSSTDVSWMRVWQPEPAADATDFIAFLRSKRQMSSSVRKSATCSCRTERRSLSSSTVCTQALFILLLSFLVVQLTSRTSMKISSSSACSCFCDHTSITASAITTIACSGCIVGQTSCRKSAVTKFKCFTLGVSCFVLRESR